MEEDSLPKLVWSGWDLEDNAFGDEFDNEARHRMVLGASYLKDFMFDFPSGVNILEFGPFFNPIMTKKNTNSDQVVFYIENDPHAIAWLNEEQCGENVAVLKFDINRLSQECFLQQSPNNLKKIKNFDVVILSQVLNYIDYVAFIENLKPYLKKGCLIFINNVISYGIPNLFHDDRPKSVNQTVFDFMQLGFRLIRQELCPPPRENDDNRLLMCVQYVEVNSNSESSAEKSAPPLAQTKILATST